MFKRIKRLYIKLIKTGSGSTICFKNMRNSTNGFIFPDGKGEIETTNGLSIESYFSQGNITEVKR